MSFALREAVEADIPAFYEHQNDEASWRMAGITPRAGEAFDAHRKKCLADARIRKYAILDDGAVIGHAVCFPENWDGPEMMVGYWLARPHWGRGAASFALGELLRLVPRRPLDAIVSESNAASRRVLAKHGFREIARLPDGALRLRLGP